MTTDSATSSQAAVAHAFRVAIEAHDDAAACELFADDITFRSPAVFTPYQGKGATSVIIHAVNTVFENFRYTAAVHGDDLSVLVFEANVGDIQLEGADFIRVNEAGQIADFRVMIRPLKGLHTVVEGMGKAIPVAMQKLGVTPEQMKSH